MKYKLFLCALLLILTSETRAQVSGDNNSAGYYLKFNINDLLSYQKQKHKDSSTFLNENTITGKVIHIKKHGKFNDLSIHNLIYYIVDGMGKLKTGDTIITLYKGSVVSVPCNAHTAFYEIESPINAIELISLEDQNKGDSHSKSFSPVQIQAGRLPGKNVFNVFLKNKSLLSGYYMLPKNLGGDSIVYTHFFDEVNIVTAGSGKLIVGNDNIPARPGDIVYVKRGTGHSFNSLEQDMDVLIFFEMRSTQQ